MAPAKGTGTESASQRAGIRAEPDIVPGQPFRAEMRTAIRCGFLVATIVPVTDNEAGQVTDIEPIAMDDVANAFLPGHGRDAERHLKYVRSQGCRHQAICVAGRQGLIFNGLF